jgi:hypothetical protein
MSTPRVWVQGRAPRKRISALQARPGPRPPWSRWPRIISHLATQPGQLPLCPFLCMAGPLHCAWGLLSWRQRARQRPCTLHCTAAGSLARACVRSTPRSAPTHTSSPKRIGACRSCGGKRAAGAPAPAAAFSLRFRFNAAGHREVRGALAHPARPLPRKRLCPRPPGAPGAALRRARGESGGRSARRWKACGPTRPWHRSSITWTGAPRRTRSPPPWTRRRSMRTLPARPARAQSAAARRGVPRRVNRATRASYMLRPRRSPQGWDRPHCQSP